MRCGNLLWRRHVMIGALLVGVWAAAQATAAPDPLAELRQALPQDDVRDPTDAILNYRRDNLTKKIAALTTIGDLRRALALNDWRDAPHYDLVDPKIRAIDNQKRSEVGERLNSALTAQARSTDPNAKAAVAALLAEIGAGIRALGKDDRGGYARSHTGLLIGLTADPNAGVRQEALRALGNINANAKSASDVYAQVLSQKGAAVAERRLAADGLAQMVRVAAHLRKTGRGSGIEVTPTEVIETLAQVVRASTAGFRDADVQVRLLSLEAFRLATQTVSDDVIPRTYTALEPKDYPPTGRPLSKYEVDKISELYNEVQADVNVLKKMFETLRAHLSAVLPPLRDSDAGVRLAGMNDLKEVATAWQRMRRHVLGLPPFPARGPAATMIDGLDPLEKTVKEQLQAVAPLMSAPDSPTRRAAATYLLLVDERAAPMVELLNAGLTDSDRAIRWICARALQNLTAEQFVGAVPNLAKLLFDADLTLRLVAAETLKGMGPLARAAVDSLADATLRGDADGRRAAMQAITALGPDIAKAAVPKLVEALGQADADPKVLADAADTLGNIGAGAKSALPALRRLISHDNSDVRLAASEAILAISAAGNGKK